MSDPEGLTYEPGLDGLRAVAIASVLCFHAFASSGVTGWFLGGNLGVSVFFTLSGFLITSLLLREQQQTGSVRVGRFLARRVRRLLPAAATVTVLVVVLSRTKWLSLHVSDAVGAVWSFTNWHVIASGQDALLRTIVGPLGPTWSLAVEEQVYLGLLILVLLCARARPVALPISLALVCAGSWIAANLVSNWSPRLEFGTDVRAGEIAIGALLAVVVQRVPDLATRRRWLDAVSSTAFVALTVCIVRVNYRPPWLLRGGFGVIAALSACAVLGVVSHGPLHRLLSAAPLVQVGRISYSLYLVHWPVFLVLTEARVGVAGWALVGVKIGVAIVIATLLHVAIERPFRRLELAPHRALSAWLVTSGAVTALAMLVL